MTFYNEQVIKLCDELFSKEYQINQIAVAKLFIDSHFSDNIDLNCLSGVSLFSKFHFIRLFKRYYGRTPYQYLTEVRVARAKQLLKSGIPVSQACFSVGFDSVTSFTGLFKKITGSTPSGCKVK